MGKLKVIGRLKNGENVIGKLVDTSVDMVKLESQDGETTIRVSVPENIVDTIDDEIETDSIIEIKAVGTSFEIFTHDEWPEENKA